MKTAWHGSKVMMALILAGLFLCVTVTAKAQAAYNPWEGKYYQRQAGPADDQPSAEDLKWEAGFRGKMGLTVTANDGLIEGGYGLSGNFRFKHLDRVQIKVTRPDYEMLQSREGYALQTWYVPVAWGIRKYLIHTNDLIAFCNAVNEGEEPRKNRFGNFLMQEDDETKEVSGWPEVPLDHRRYLLSKPVEAIITKVGKLEEKKEGAYPKVVEIELNQGSKAGLVVGMAMRFDQAVRDKLMDAADYRGVEFQPITQITVKSVAVESAVAELQMIAAVKRLPEAGQKVFALGGKQHPWSGNYYMRDGAGELSAQSLTLTLEPNDMITRKMYGAYGVYDSKNRSEAEVRVSRLMVALMLSRQAYGKGISNWQAGAEFSYIPVAWGERRYLVRENDLVSFCNAVNAGTEPRASRYGAFLLREGDERKKVAGLPQVPLRYQKHLIKKPLEAVITRVGEMKKTEDRWFSKVVEVSLNLGSQDGVVEGMGFQVGQEIHRKAKEGIPELQHYPVSMTPLIEIKVKSVSRESSVAEVRIYGQLEWMPEAGMKLSTRLR